MIRKEEFTKLDIIRIYESYLLEYSTRKNISSPFTQDRTPSFRLYENGTFKCYSSGKQGDVFQFVAYMEEVNCKREFREVLKIAYKKAKKWKY